MKTKYVVFLILTFIGLESTAQNGHLYPTVMPVKENGYSGWEFENFALGGSSISQDYKEKIVDRVKQFCSDVGVYPTDENGNPLRTTDDWVRWTFSPGRTWVEDRTYDNGFWNSHQSSDGRKVVLYWDKRPFRGPVLVLHVEGYELDLGKTACANFVKVSYVVKKKEQFQTEQRQPSGTIEDNNRSKESIFSPSLSLENQTFTIPPQKITTTKKVVDWKKVAIASAIITAVGIGTGVVINNWDNLFGKPTTIVTTTTPTGHGNDPSGHGKSLPVPTIPTKYQVGISLRL
ncbi:MAG: hypothetical protein WCT42_00525 [Candidatus Paceibacterota bacterium]